MSSLSCCDLVEALLCPRELLAIAQLLAAKAVGGGAERRILKEGGHRAFCYRSLKAVSRSFAAVVLQLKDEVRDAVCVFYLVLRALDTIEDDMSIPDAEKRPQLLAFHAKLDLDSYAVEGVGHGHERILLERFSDVLRMYRELRPAFRATIKSITQQMGAGMSEFTERRVESVADYDDYCFYVAGLVGYGLTDIFAADGCDPQAGREQQRSMGLFLQKVNICRDYLEDQTDPDGPRCWWPREIWERHADDLGDFLKPEKRGEAVACLNDMVADALERVPHVMEYLAGLDEPSIFAFCAIPQVMAVATLAEVYNNPSVFEGKVKMRKGAAARVMTTARTLRDTKALFREYFGVLRAKAADKAFLQRLDALEAHCA